MTIRRGGLLRNRVELYMNYRSCSFTSLPVKAIFRSNTCVLQEKLTRNGGGIAVVAAFRLVNTGS